VVAAALCLAVAGCSSSSGTNSAGPATESNPLGDIPDDTAYVPYTPQDGSFSVGVPEGWSRTESGSSVSFTDKLNTVSVQELTGRPQPTVDSVRTGELATAVAAGGNGQAGAVETVTLPAGPAVHGKYSVDGPTNEVTGRSVRDDVEMYVFWKNGNEVVLGLSGPHGADNVDPWRMISTSFTWQG
jgi:hypothetical protein